MANRRQRRQFTVVAADFLYAVKSATARGVSGAVTLRRETADRVDVVETDAADRRRHGDRQLRQYGQHPHPEHRQRSPAQQHHHHPPTASLIRLRSTLRGAAKWVSAFALSNNNKWR